MPIVSAKRETGKSRQWRGRFVHMGWKEKLEGETLEFKEKTLV